MIMLADPRDISVAVIGHSPGLDAPRPLLF